jgi:hypothetical protein
MLRLLLVPLALAAAPCPGPRHCLAILSCPAALAALQEGRADPAARRRAVAAIRESICDREQQKVCCAATLVGPLERLIHLDNGTVYMLSDSTLLIKNLVYDGEGPDAFFLAGTEGARPSDSQPSSLVVLPHAAPRAAARLAYSDPAIPALPAFTGGQELVLRLPEGVTVSSLRWLSLWCRDFGVNFGHVTFPRP